MKKITKIILAGFFLLLFFGSTNFASAAVALVQEKVSDAWSTGAAINITGISTPTNGNLLVLYYRSNNLTNTINNISQTGATWARAVSALVSTPNIEIWYAENVSSAGTTITINLNGTPSASGTQSAAMSEWSGFTTGTLDQTGQQLQSATTAPATNTITPTSSRNSVIIGALASGGSITPTHGNPTNSFTSLLSSDGDVRGEGAYLIVSSTSGSYSTAWTTASTTSHTAIANFLAPSAGGSLIKTYLGIAVASVKTVFGVAMASVKKFNGVANQ